MGKRVFIYSRLLNIIFLRRLLCSEVVYKPIVTMFCREFLL